jgi:quinol monooxygenase YgiN
MERAAAEESRVPDDRYGGSDAITFVATVTIKPEHEEEYLALVAAMADKILANEPGTTLHVLHKHPTEPYTYVAVERYRDAEAWNAHAEAPYLCETLGQLEEWLTKPVDVLQLSQMVPS